METFYTGDGRAIKALTLTNMPPEAWHNLVGDGDEKDAAKLYQAVAWLFRTVNIRAQAVAGMPWELRRGETVVLSSGDPQPPGEWAWLSGLPSLLLRTEAAAVLEGRAYWHKRRERPRNAEDLQWLLPGSITPKYRKQDGRLTGFERHRNAGNEPQQMAPDEVIHFWPPDPYVEIGPQKNTPAMAALSSAGVLHNLEEFTAAFFERGAVKATLLTYEEMLSPDERQRVKEWWQRVVSGIKNAFSSEVVRSDMKPVIIGEGLESLSNTELTKMEREAICTALGVPQSKVTANAANFATKQSDDVMFISDTVAPECGWLATVLNEQLFKALGVSFRFLPDTLSVMQEDEAQRAQSLLNLVNAGISLEMAVEILGYDLPDGIDLREPKPDPPPMLPPMQQEPPPPPESPDVAQEKAVFRRWLKNRDDPDPADFVTDVLTEQQKALVMLEMGIYPKGDGDAEDTPFGKATRDPLNPDGREMQRMEREFAAAVEDALARLLRDLRRGVSADNAREMLQRMNDRAVMQPFRDAVTAQVQRVALAGAEHGRNQIERAVFGTKRDIDWQRANNSVAEWALQYGYDLVSGLNQTTRDRLAAEIAAFTENGETLPQLIDRLTLPGGPFSAERARLVGVTEVTRAYAAGSLRAWREAGVVQKKEWRTANDELVCPICGPLANKVAPLDGEFDSANGRLEHPPAHPRCRCWVVPKVD